MGIVQLNLRSTKESLGQIRHTGALRSVPMMLKAYFRIFKVKMLERRHGGKQKIDLLHN